MINKFLLPVFGAGYCIQFPTAKNPFRPYPATIFCRKMFFFLRLLTFLRRKMPYPRHLFTIFRRKLPFLRSLLNIFRRKLLFLLRLLTIFYSKMPFHPQLLTIFRRKMPDFRQNRTPHTSAVFGIIGGRRILQEVVIIKCNITS